MKQQKGIKGQGKTQGKKSQTKVCRESSKMRTAQREYGELARRQLDNSTLEGSPRM